MHFLIYIVRKGCLVVLHSTYVIIYHSLTLNEWCCWHLDQMIEAQITMRGGYRQVSMSLRIINHWARLSWRFHMRTLAILYMLYMTTGGSDRQWSFSDYQILACVDSDGPRFY